MTLAQYQEQILKLTEDFCGPIRLEFGNPCIIRVPLRLPNEDAGIMIQIGFKEDLDA